MTKWERRDQKLRSKKNKMPKHGRSVFLIQSILIKRSNAGNS